MREGWRPTKDPGERRTAVMPRRVLWRTPPRGPSLPVSWRRHIDTRRCLREREPRTPELSAVCVPCHGAGERTDMDHPIPAYIDNLDDSLGLRVAADDEGTGDDPSGVGGFA